MEGDKHFKENGPPDSPPAHVANEPASTTPHNNGDSINIPKPAPEENLMSFSPVVGGETPQSPSASDSEPKIVARLTPDDEFVPYKAPPSSYHRRAASVDQIVAKVPLSYTSSPTMTRSKLSGIADPSRVNIDTAAPIESVKAAVSKFGGIVDWKAHRVQTVERRKFIEQELEKAQEEMPSYKQQCEAAEEAKAQVLKELDSTKRLIEELKLNLERAQKEEQQAKQDSELAKLRVEEMEQGIADESSFAAKAQLEVARARHAAAVSELATVKEELEQLRKDFTLLVSEKDTAEKKAAEAVSLSREVEKSVENLTIELITLKQSLESAHSEHLEAEEHRIHAVMAKEQDTLSWEEELKQADEEIQKLNQQMMSTKDLKLKLNEATTLLHDLKSELSAYMEAKLDEHALKETDQKTRGDIEAAITTAKKELAEVRFEFEKKTEQVNVSKIESASLEAELEKEKAELVRIQQKERMASIALASIEAELSTTESEIALVRMKEKEESVKMAELPKKLEEAARKADEAKALSQKAHEDLEKAKDEAEQAKACKLAKESKLRAAQKEIEAARASEKLALAAINALEESESAQKINDQDSPTSGVTLSLEEYYELSKRAHEVEEEANARMAAAISLIEAAKESELRSLNKLEEVSHEMSNRKAELEIVQKKAEQATEGKLAVEQELRKWRAENEQKRKEAVDQSGPAPIVTGHDNGKKALHQRLSPKSLAASGGEKESELGHDSKATKKKKKSFFPRIFMFLARKKVQASKKE